MSGACRSKVADRDAYVAALLDAAPPLRAEQLARLGVLLRPTGTPARSSKAVEKMQQAAT